MKRPVNHIPRTRASHSLEETNVGWFPTAPVQKPVRGEWTELEDPWRNGSLLSELIAKLLVDEKSLVKEVEHFDKNGRLLLPPKLLLKGTELVVKSKAQAIHNIQLSLQALLKIQNFPKVDYLAEDLFEESRYMFELFQLIQSVFDIRGMDVRTGRATHIQSHRRLLARRLPGRRSSSAPPVLEEAMRQRIPNANVQIRKPQPNEYYRKIGSPERKREDRADRKVSPEPNVRRNAPRPSSISHPHQLISSSSQLKHLFSQINEPARSRNPANQTSPHPQIRSSYLKPHRSRSLSPQLIRAGQRQTTALPHQSSPSQRQRQRTSSSFLEDRHATSGVHNNSSFLSAANLSWSMKPAAKSSKSYDAATLHPQRYHSYSPAKPLKEYSEQLHKLTATRQAAMTRERLQAQERDRRIRRRSFLDKYQQSEDFRKRLLSVNSAISAESSETGARSRSRGRMRDSEVPVPSLSGVVPDRRDSNLSSKPSIGTVGNRPSSVRSSLTNRSAPRPAAARDWTPPPLDPAEIDKAKAQCPVLPVVTKAQQTAIRDWLLSHGISILDGEGGYYHSDDPRLEGNSNLAVNSSSPQLGLLPLPLTKDRLRNGETLCILFCYLEPTAAFHAHLFQLIQRSPRTIHGARANLDKVLWLFRVRRSPPLPMIYLCQPEEIVKCNKEVLWGLLWEIMQSYGGLANGPSALGYVSTNSFGNLQPQPVNTNYYRASQQPALPTSVSSVAGSTRGPSATTTLSSQSAAIQSSRSYHYELPYNPLQRRSLDLSLLEWLDATGILRLALGNIARPPTVLALESYIKDGTLFCLILERGLTLPLPSSYHKHPHSYSQCLANLRKCLVVLRGCKGMCSRYLYQGVEEDIARGQWDCILGLLEDLHLFYDTIQQYWVFPVRRNSLPGAMGLEDHSKTAISSIPPMVSSWQQIDRPYLSLASVHRQGESSSRETPSPRLSSMRDSAASTINFQNPHHPLSSPAVFSAAETTASNPQLTGQTVSEERSNVAHRDFQQFNQRANQVRLDKYVPHPEPSEEPSLSSRPNHSLKPTTLPFQPRLDLRNTLPKDSDLSEDDEGGSEDENDVSFLFSPSHEEKRVSSNGEEDLLPKQYPSVADMTAVDPAMGLLGTSRSPASSPDTLPQSPPSRNSQKSSSRSPSPAKGREESKECPTNSSILSALSTIIDWFMMLGVALPIPKHFYRLYTGNPLQDYSIENVIVNASLLDDFGTWFSSGVLLAQAVSRVTHLEIAGVVRTPKTQAQRLNNIRKSLEMLALNNKKIPLRLLSCEEEVLRGDSVTVLQLLEAMKRAYHFVR